MEKNKSIDVISSYCTQRFHQDPLEISLLSKIDNKNKVFKIVFRNKTYLLKLFSNTDIAIRRCRTERQMSALINHKVTFEVPSYIFDNSSIGPILLREYIEGFDLKIYLLNRLKQGEDISSYLQRSITAIRQVHNILSSDKFGNLWLQERFNTFLDFTIYEDLYSICNIDKETFLGSFRECRFFSS